MQLTIAAQVVRGFIQQIKEIEEDAQTSNIERLAQIKKIRQEIAKVGEHVDNLKKEIIILNTRHSN